MSELVSLGGEQPVVFSCKGERLIGVLHRPPEPQKTGIIVVTGAPQYRIGSHRQYVLLGRRLAEAGFLVLRFDYRGMGDSDGEFVGFEGVDDDIKAAIDFMFAEVDGLKRVVLWGLCDGASAAGFYADKDARVGGLVLVNPWVRTLATMAQARVKYYYQAQILSAEFWRRLVGGEVQWAAAIKGFGRSVRQTVMPSRQKGPTPDLPTRVGDSLRRFEGPILLILSGADLTAQEFDTAVLGSPAMKSWLGESRIQLHRLTGANHTYSRRTWRDQVHVWTEDWLHQIS